MTGTVYTVGHSTRTLEELVAVLQEAGVRALVDVRTVPRSRRHPQFERDALERSLPAHGIDYRHEKALGGFRRPSEDSPNAGWEHPAFRGYADYMRTPDFRSALERLEVAARWDAEDAVLVDLADADVVLRGRGGGHRRTLLTVVSVHCRTRS